MAWEVLETVRQDYLIKEERAFEFHTNNHTINIICFPNGEAHIQGDKSIKIVDERI